MTFEGFGCFIFFGFIIGICVFYTWAIYGEDDDGGTGHC